jgi:hypothetical protein
MALTTVLSAARHYNVNDGEPVIPYSLEAGTNPRPTPGCSALFGDGLRANPHLPTLLGHGLPVGFLAMADDRPNDDIRWYAPGHHRVGIPGSVSPARKSGGCAIPLPVASSPASCATTREPWAGGP